MSFIRVKTVNGVNYYSLVKSVREGKKVRQKLVRYFGKELPDAYKNDKPQKMRATSLSELKTKTIRVSMDDYMTLDKIRNQKNTNSPNYLNMGDTIHEVVEHYQNSMHPPA